MTTLLTGARLLDADGARDGWLLLDADRISATGTTGADTPPAASAVLDLTGRTLTPGFIDLHGHGGGGAAYDNGADEIATAPRGRSSLWSQTRLPRCGRHLNSSPS